MWNWAENQVTLVFIRHGETNANSEHRYLGKTDEVLSEGGIKTLVSYKEQNYYPNVEYLFSSPMTRCLETAKILYPNLHPTIIPEWTEMDFGEFEYKNYKELKEDARYQAWINSGGTLAFPGGESRENFMKRCERGFVKMCDELCRQAERHIEKNMRAGIIVHGGTIMALMSLHDKIVQKDYFDYQAANGRGYVCCIKGFGEQIQMEEVKKL